MTPSEYDKARRLLMRRDPVLRDAIKRIGPCLMADRQRNDHLTALVGAIVSQQLSTKAAATIFGRFASLFPDARITADGIRALTDLQLRGVGFSGQKIGYLRDLCARIADGSLRLDELEQLSDAGVIERLTAVKGFGQWTEFSLFECFLTKKEVLQMRAKLNMHLRAVDCGKRVNKTLAS